MFRIGDTVIHPGYGAGTMVDIGELLCLGSDKPCYSIELSDGSKTRVWVPVRDARKRGVRHPTPMSQLARYDASCVPARRRCPPITTSGMNCCRKSFAVATFSGSRRSCEICFGRITVHVD